MDFLGDPFASDRTLHAETPIGFDIVSSDSSLCSSTSAAEEVKSNIVAYIKADGLPNNCRRMIAVSNLYTCYVVKKTLLRCIHTVSTLNLVIRGHTSAVLDIKFSPAASDILCSVDNASTEGSHIFIFQLVSQEDSLTSKTLCEMKLKAQMVHPHPLLPQVWVFANGDKVGIISYNMAGVGAISEYEQLPLFIQTSTPITDISFSSDAQQLIICTNDRVETWKLPPANALLTGQGTLTKAGCIDFSVPNLLHCTFTNHGVITVSSGKANDNQIQVLVHLWLLSSASYQKTQTLTINFPKHKNAQTLSSVGLHYEISACYSKEFIVISCRQSHLVACITVDVTGKRQYHLSHASFLDFTWPVSYMDFTMVAERGHHSEEEVEHLEFCCYQEAEKSAVAQYHVSRERLVCNLPITPNNFFATNAATPVAMNLEPVVPVSSGRSIMSMLTEAKSSFPSSPSTFPPTSPLLPTSMSSEIKSPPSSSSSSSPTLLSPSDAVNREKSNVSFLPDGGAKIQSPATTPPTPPSAGDLPEILRTGNVQGRTLLGMITMGRSGDTSIASKVSTPTPLATPPTVSAPAATAKATTTPTTTTTTTAPVPLSDSSSNLNIQEAPASTEILKEVTANSSLQKEVALQDAASHDLLNDIKASVLRAESKSLSQNSLVSLRGDIVKDVIKGTADQIKKSIDASNVENKKNIDAAIHSKKFQDEIAAQIVASIQADIAPLVAQRVKEAVKDTVKGALTSTFRVAFENSLLPAFQAGTDRMFAQVQEAFEVGMEGLIEQGRISQQLSRESNESLLAEVAALRATVASLEAKVAELTKQGASPTTTQNESPLVDPLTLLEKGRISDAVECALEYKSIAELVRLLEKISPQTLLANCSSLLLLCTVQQLAADFSAQDPAEGIAKRLEWLKSLMMGLLLSPNTNESSDDTQTKKSLLKVIHDYLQITADRFSVQSQSGEEGMEGLAGYTTDIRLLIHIIGSKL